MAGFNGFNSWDELANYIDNTMNISYTEDPTSWVNAMKDLMKGYKYVNIINETTGEHTTEIWPEDLMEGVGEVYIGDNTTSSSTVSGGGAKSVPTAKTIITNSATQTAVITEEATGVKDNGIVSGTKAINIIGGLLQIYGLITTGIEIANAQVWKDMSNYVFDSDFTEDTPVERVIDFLGNKIVNSITDITSDGDIVTNIPDSIAQRMYEFLSNHMVMEQTPGIYPNYEVFDVVYNFIQRTLVLSDPSTYTLERYRSVSNPTASCLLYLSEIGDDIFKVFVGDFITQLIGSGFIIASSVATALLASMEGLYLAFKDYSVDDVDECQFCEAQCILYRGETPPPKETPIALSEITLRISCQKNTRITVHDGENGDYVIINFNLLPDTAPPLAAGSSYTQGDLVKYLKRGSEGTSANDYAYRFRCAEYSGSGTSDFTINCDVTYPSNEQVLDFSRSGSGSIFHSSAHETNGFNSRDYYITQNSGSYYSNYTNLGYLGHVGSYQPDDYLVTAGFRSKTGVNGNPEIHPNPTKTKEEVYPGLNNKKQQANPQARIESGAVVVGNNIVGYVPTSVPFGSANAQRIINHGINNPADPESYIDNRPQDIKSTGIVNTADPIDGINEDIATNIDEYNDSRHDPDHYPDPIPSNEPNPQYPDNPPSDTEGDTGEAPSPSVMPGVTASGMVSVYNPTKAEVKNFSAWLWTDSVIENLKKILANPIDAIIGMHIMYATPVTGSPENIVCGYLDSGVAAKVVTQQYIDVDCGYIEVPEYYGTALDYEPYTQIHIYLPFVGIQSLKANDVIGKKLYVSYGVDVLTGTCLARLTTKKGSSEICCYQFPGNCAVQIPLTGGSYAECIKAIASMAVGIAGSVATGNPLPAIGGVIGGAMSASLDVSHSGSLGANAGVMGIRKPYLIITRRIAYEAAGYSQFYGYPANKTVTLGSCLGFTRVKSVHIDSIPVATDSEKSEIESLLKQGVIIK